MAEYEVKRGLTKSVDLKGLFEAHFGSAKLENGWIVGQYGNMTRIAVKYDKTQLFVETQSDPGLAKKVAAGDKAAMEMFQETHKRWNTFLFDATGYDSKTRGKKAQDKLKKEGKEAAAA